MVYDKRFLDLQMTFAERVCAISDIDLDDALFEYTNLYVRFGLGRDFDRDNESWRSYLAGLRSATDRRNWTYRFYLNDAEARTSPPVVARFGCFSYAIRDENVVRLHFVNAEPDDESPLSAARIGSRQSELAALFAHAKRLVGSDAIVVGRSWLYNLDAYRRLFPPAYSDSPTIANGGFRWMALWGQFATRRGELRESASDTLLHALELQNSLADVESCFPLRVLETSAPIEAFHAHYGV